MVKKLDIAQSIYASAKPSSGCKLLGAGQIAEYFQEISPAVQEKWPFDFSELGFETEYLSVNRETMQAGAIPNINIKSLIKNSNESYVFNSTWQVYDGQISLSLDELRRLKSSSNHTRHFAGHLLKKMQSFLIAQDKVCLEELPSCAKNCFDPSIITLTATSNNSKTTNSGGLVVASLGLDFANRDELLQTRRAFKLYAQNQGVEIATKDMELFTKPCHFLAFDCGLTIKDKNEHSTTLGKAFLILHSWDGIWKNEHPQAEEKRYANAYFHDEPNPSEQLNSSYRKMLKRYQNKYGTLQKKKRLSSYKSRLISSLRSFIK